MKTSSYALIKRVVSGYVRPYFGLIGKAAIFMVLAAMANGAFAGLMEPLLDYTLQPGGEAYLIPVVAGLIFIFVVRGLAGYAHTVIMNRIGHSIVADIQQSMFNHYMVMDLAFFGRHHSGELLSKIINASAVMRMAVADTLAALGKSSLTLLALIAVMLYQDWVLTLAGAILTPILGFVVAYIGRRIRKLSKQTLEQTAGFTSMLSQTFQGIRIVKAYRMEAHEREKAQTLTGKLRDLNIKAYNISNLSTPVNEIVAGLSMAAIVVYGSMQINAGEMTAGELMSFVTAFLLAYEPLKKLAKINSTLQTGLGAAERIFEVLDQLPNLTDPQMPKSIPAGDLDITFENVSFSYEDVSRTAIKDISFTVKPGTTTALVGLSGGGKTTIMNLIPRFYDVDAGGISIGGVDVREVRMAELRGSMALVTQDTTIFDDTVYNNIGYGRPNSEEPAQIEDILEASKAAAAHEFIKDMPQGYDTRVGENGLKLSGGQRQRIAIARALLRDAPILLLDEATSALDNESEKLIQETLEKAREGRTTLVIAHRLSTVQNADEIIVLEAGKIVERGTHDTLLKADGPYAKMYGLGALG